MGEAVVMMLVRSGACWRGTRSALQGYRTP
ncbi:hypothetical protein EE612_057064 [Oryza sativa]|nr:hypothetical protein EE612_057064 [Oryza sativa]